MTKSRVSGSNLGRFLALTGAQRRLWVAAWWRLLAADLGLRFGRRAALGRALASVGAGSGDASDEVAEQVARAVASAAAHHLWPMTCLPRSLVLWRMLVARGIPARVRIGVDRSDGALRAHAWVEAGGRPLGEPERVEERFLPLVESGRDPG